MSLPLSRDECVKLDDADPLRAFRAEFVLPAGLVYLTGNSLGALPRTVPERVARTVEQEWGHGLVGSWTTAGWWDKPRTLGRLLAPLVGAEPDEVVVGDGTSANLFKAAVAALRLNPDRRVLVGERGNFPTDLYIADSAAELCGAEHRRTEVSHEALEEALRGADVAAVLLSHVDYRTGELRDMRALTELAHRHDALIVWDLCHSVGALPIALDECEADFAVGCTYKYLNGGPGAPAFLYAARRHHDTAHQPLPGWHGHAAPFDAAEDYTPAPGASRFLSGSQPIVADAALEASLELWQRVDLRRLREKSLALTDLFLDLTAPAGLPSVTPTDHAARGSQICLRHPNGYPVMRALIERGVVGDFRAPDVLRFGFAPLYLRFVDVYDAARALLEVLDSGEWREERFQRRLTVT